PAGFGVDMRFLQQRHADAEYDATDQLAACGLGVDDAPTVERTDEAAHADLTEIGIDPHLRELCTECVHRVALLLLTGLHLATRLNRTQIATCQQLRHAHTYIAVIAQLGTHSLTGGLYCGADAGDGHRSTGHGCMWEATVAQLEADTLHRNAEF